MLCLDDPMDTMNKSKAYYRIIHLSEDAPDLLVRITGVGRENYPLSYTDYSGIVDTKARDYDIDVYEAATDSLIFNIKDIDMRAGYFYNLILRGYYSKFHHIRIKCLIVENRIM